MYSTDISRPKCPDFSCKQYIFWECSGILTQNIMHEYLILFKNFHEFYQFFLSEFLGQNFLIPPDQTVS